MTDPNEDVEPVTERMFKAPAPERRTKTEPSFRSVQLESKPPCSRPPVELRVVDASGKEVKL